MDLFEDSTAIFSEDRKYRYALIRTWDANKPKIMFIGLNPSTANENKNDPTIRRVIRFAMDWGYGGVYMLNLFAVVSSDPKILLNCADPVGENDKYIETFSSLSKDILFAWGNFKGIESRAKKMIKKFTSSVCLGINKNGSPKHPLYVKGDTPATLFMEQ